MHETYEVSPAALEDYMTGYAGTRFGESARFVRNYPTDFGAARGSAAADPDAGEDPLQRSRPSGPAQQPEYLAERLPRSELTVLDAGHFAWEDQADAYGGAALAWLDGGFARVEGDA